MFFVSNQKENIGSHFSAVFRDKTKIAQIPRAGTKPKQNVCFRLERLKRKVVGTWNYLNKKKTQSTNIYKTMMRIDHKQESKACSVSSDEQCLRLRVFATSHSHPPWPPFSAAPPSWGCAQQWKGPHSQVHQLQTQKSQAEENLPHNL